MFFRSMYELERLQIFTGKQNSQKLADLAKSTTILIAHTKCTTAKNLLIDSQNPLIPHVQRTKISPTVHVHVQYTYVYMYVYLYFRKYDMMFISGSTVHVFYLRRYPYTCTRTVHVHVRVLFYEQFR